MVIEIAFSDPWHTLQLTDPAALRGITGLYMQENKEISYLADNKHCMENSNMAYMWLRSKFSLPRVGSPIWYSLYEGDG